MIEIVRHPIVSELISREPAFAFRRYVSSTSFQRVMRRESGFCTWCNSPVLPPRVRWCSKACISTADIYLNDGIAARVARERDKWTCVLCGSQDGNVEVDHIIPVCRGGGLCGPDNLRTLCVPCHKIETVSLHQQLALESKARWEAVNA